MKSIPDNTQAEGAKTLPFAKTLSFVFTLLGKSNSAYLCRYTNYLTHEKFEDPRNRKR